MRRFGAKYGARKITLPDGSRFDSKLEYSRYLVLCDWADKGIIQDLQRQVKFELIPTQYVEVKQLSKRGKETSKQRVAERPCFYVADFVYTYQGQQIVEDSKGKRTPEYVIKRKLMRLNGHPIFETKSPTQPITIQL